MARLRYMSLRISKIVSLLCLVSLVFPQVARAQSGSETLGVRNDLKVTLLSLGSGSTRITYERAFSRRNSGEVTLGVVGWGWDWMNHSHPRGMLMKAAYKWRLVPQQSSHSWLAGLYVSLSSCGRSLCMEQGIWAETMVALSILSGRCRRRFWPNAAISLCSTGLCLTFTAALGLLSARAMQTIITIVLCFYLPTAG